MRSARISARPGVPGEETFVAGTHPLRLGDRRDGLLVVPPGAAPGASLLVALHGAGGTGRQMADLLQAEAARQRLLVLAPDSRDSTWDVIRGGYGPDVAFLETALASVFAGFAVGSVAVAGFSDGASYALSIGVANGDLFEHVLAWSPGFLAPADAVGRPRVFVSHGKGDRVLPVDRCSRRLVPGLRADGYDVRYEEFDGGHVVPAGILEVSLERLGAQPG
jgi:phospholipase/carboxylesterase